MDHPNALSQDSRALGVGTSDVYLTSGESGFLERFTTGGLFAWKWPQGPGMGAAALSIPYGVAVDGNANVFVADSGNGRIVKFACP